MKFCHFCPPEKAALGKIHSPLETIFPTPMNVVCCFCHQACNNNAVFIEDVSRVCKLICSEDRQETKSKRARTLHFKKFSEWYTNKRIRNALEIPIC